MKKVFLLTLFISITIFGCEDVIDVELNDSESRLVIDALINWEKETPGNLQSIHLSLTAPFFNTTLPPANNATVNITDSNDNVFNFTEFNNTGTYINNNFTPIIDETYTLNIIYEGETYTATETLKPVSPIDFIEQKNDGGFSGEDIELKAYYTDPEGVENYYLFEFISDIPKIANIEVYDDEFTDGNQIFGYYSEEDLESGDEVIIRNHGISKDFYEFMFVLLQQTDSDSGDPFETQPATVRGNCINETNPDNYPFGYFSLSEVSVFTYIVE